MAADGPSTSSNEAVVNPYEGAANKRLTEADTKFVKKFFTFASTTERFKCLMPGCKGSLCKSSTPAHYGQHLARFHLKEAKAEQATFGFWWEHCQRLQAESICNRVLNNTPGRYFTEDSPTQMKLTISFDLNRLVVNFLGRIAAGNISLRTAAAMAEWELPKLVFQSFRVSITRKNLRQIYYHAGNLISEILQDVLADKLYHLTFDCVTCGGRHFVGVTLRYMDDGKIYEIFLGIISEFDHHTGKILAADVEKVVRKVFYYSIYNFIK